VAVARVPERSPFPDLFHPAVKAWLDETFAAPTRAQAQGWPEIVAGNSTLILAPTGSGKTLAAFLAAIDRLMFSPVPAKQARCRVLYISPLRALAFDVERNLRAPLVGIARVAERRGDAVNVPTVALRTGDTEAGERARMLRTPPDILITTPESLYLMLTSQARSILQSVELVIVDEIHTLAGTKRGAHLALSLERLTHLAGRPIQRVGLSATQRPLDEVARYLGGGVPAGRCLLRPPGVWSGCRVPLASSMLASARRSTCASRYRSRICHASARRSSQARARSQRAPPACCVATRSGPPSTRAS
jgi:ATP-dependent Lhr-like helicase